MRLAAVARRDFTRLSHIAKGQLKKAGFFVIISPRYIVARSHGEVPEWLNGAVSKTAVALWVTQGSNPCLSAIYQKPGFFSLDGIEHPAWRNPVSLFV
jgi:hypothetical protein